MIIPVLDIYREDARTLPGIANETYTLSKNKTMFERYTEKARRVIFFARYEASQYGSPFIETEHLLLGLLREDRVMAKWLAIESIRKEIESAITVRERILLSVEVPLTQEGKRILMFAADEAEMLKHRHIGTEHLLLGILREEKCVAARILLSRGVEIQAFRNKLAQSTPKDGTIREVATVGEHKQGGLSTLESFLSGLKSLNSENLISFFAKNAQFIDSSGRRWNRDEIWKGFEALFALYGKKNASFVIEATLADTHELFVANIRWNNALLASEQRAWMHLMSIVLVFGTDEWEILLAQVTPLDGSASRQVSRTDSVQ